VLIESSCSIDQVKKKVYEQERVPYDQQMIMFQGTRLGDEETLNDFNPFKETYFHLIVLLKVAKL